MQLLLDCLPCLLKQALEASRLATREVEVQEKIMKESIEILRDYKSYKTSPELARAIHHEVKLATGLYDPYAEVKQKDLAAAQSVYSTLKNFLSIQENKLYWALKIAATGNNIDAAIYGSVNIEACIKGELEKEFSICDLDSFQEKLAVAKDILIIGDNTGETIFDRVLIESLTDVRVTYAVRSEPIINDVTKEDAIASGLDQVSTIISSGCNAPGLILEESNDDFLQVFNHADLIISKGQGNYEALSEEKGVFFLLKAKCPMIASRLKVDLNDYVLKYSTSE